MQRRGRRDGAPRRRALGERPCRATGRRVAAPPGGPVAVLARRGTGPGRQARSRHHSGPAALAPRRGGGGRGPVDQHAQARVAAAEGPPRPRGARPQADDPLARPRHCLRGRRLPEPVGVLVRRHGHLHGARRTVHAGVRLLPRRHPPTRGARARRARARRRGDRPHGPRPRRAHDGGSRRSRRRRDGPCRRVRRRDPCPSADDAGRDAHLGRPRRRGVARDAVRRRDPTCSTTTWRPSPGCSGPCDRRPATPAASPSCLVRRLRGWSPSPG